MVTYKPIRDVHTSQGNADLNDQIKKIVAGINALEQAKQNPQGQAVAPAQIVGGGTTIVNNIQNPFKQDWLYKGNYVCLDTREVRVGAGLTLVPYGAHAVVLDDISGTTYLPASIGGWTCLNEVMPIPLWGNSLAKIRVEARFFYINTTAGTFFRVSPNPNNTAASDFVIKANYNGSAQDTTKWCLMMRNLNVVTFPAPPANTVCTIVVEFDGTNAGTGTAQWLVGIDSGNGLVQQTLTNVTNNNVGFVPQAFRLTWGSDYGDPTFSTSSTGSQSANPFDGCIAERRIFTNTSASFISPPSYTNLVGDWRPEDTVTATYIDTGIITMHQSSSGQPLSGSANIYIVTGNSIPLLYPSVAPNLSGLVPITVPIGGLAHGFPGTLSIQTTPISQTIPTYNVNYAVITPNVARIKNHAFPDEDRYDLFHIPVGNSNPLVYPQLLNAQLHTLKGYNTVEPFVGANQ